MKQKVEKIIFLGDGGVGKTQLLNRLRFFVFSPNYKPTIGIDTSNCYQVGQESDKWLHIYDTAGQERLKTFGSYNKYIKVCNQVYLVFDRNKPTSLAELQKYCDDVKSAKPDCHIVLIETKIDIKPINNSISDADIENFREKNNLYFLFKVSSANNEGIDELRNHILDNFGESYISALIGWISKDNKQISKGSKDTIKKIIDILIEGEKLKNHSGRSKYYLANEKNITSHLKSLQKTSNLKTFQNVISTIAACVACLGLVGFIPLYLNKVNRGDAFLFWTNGDKQQAELAINLAKREKYNISYSR